MHFPWYGAATMNVVAGRLRSSAVLLSKIEDGPRDHGGGDRNVECGCFTDGCMGRKAIRTPPITAVSVPFNGVQGVISRLQALVSPDVGEMAGLWLRSQHALARL